MGAGNMGGALARLRIKAGHEVAVSFARDEDKLAQLVETLGNQAHAASPAKSCEFGEVVLLTVSFDALSDAVDAIGDAARGKVVVTTVSPYAADFSGRATTMASQAGDVSAAEHIAALFDGASLVEAFNLTFADMLAIEPPIAAGRRSVAVCGDDTAAKATVARLAVDIGLDPIDVGPLTSARVVEQMATAWVQLAAVAKIFPATALTINRSQT